MNIVVYLGARPGRNPLYKEKARELVRSYSEEAVALLGTLPGDTEPLARLIRSLMDRKN